MKEGCDILCIEYGYSKKQVDIEVQKELASLIKETNESIDKALIKEYKNMIFVGKSLGTFLMNELTNKYSEKKIPENNCK